MNETKNEIVIYQPNETVRLDVRLENETVWLSQEQMVKLFGRDQSVIARHISNIFKEGELDRKVVYAKFAYTTRHGAIPGKTQVKKQRGDCPPDIKTQAESHFPPVTSSAIQLMLLS